jgi:hypothetical protein
VTWYSIISRSLASEYSPRRSTRDDVLHLAQSRMWFNAITATQIAVVDVRIASPQTSQSKPVMALLPNSRTRESLDRRSNRWLRAPSRVGAKAIDVMERAVSFSRTAPAQLAAVAWSMMWEQDSLSG